MPDRRLFLRMLGNDWNRTTEDVSLQQGCSRSVQSNFSPSGHPGLSTSLCWAKTFPAVTAWYMWFPFSQELFTIELAEVFIASPPSGRDVFVFFPWLKTNVGEVPWWSGKDGKWKSQPTGTWLAPTSLVVISENTRKSAGTLVSCFSLLYHSVLCTLTDFSCHVALTRYRYKQYSHWSCRRLHKK